MLARIVGINTGFLLLAIGPVTLVHAQPFEYYVSGNAGISFLRDAETVNTDEPEFGLDIAYKDNVILSGAFGLINDKTRSELEVSYQKHDFDDNDFTVTVSIPDFEATEETGITGDLRLITGLVNVFYDFDTRFPTFKPYITGGLGFTEASWDINAFARYTENDELLESIEIEGSDSDTAFAYQLGAGLGFVLADNVTLDLRYRYFIASNLKFFGVVETEANTHNVSAGLRVSF